MHIINALISNTGNSNELLSYTVLICGNGIIAIHYKTSLALY